MERLRRPGDERGFTIVETMVAVVLLAIVMAVLYRGMDSLQRATVGNEERLVNLEEARVVMATITKDIRAGAALQPGTAPFVAAAARELTMYANIGSTAGPSKIRMYVDTENRLIEEVTPPDPGSGPNYTYTAAPKVRAVGSYVVPGTTIFTYQYFDDATGNFVTLGNLPLSSADRLKVESVDVSLSIRKSSTAPTPATTLRNRVRLTNVYYNPASAS